VVLDREEQRKRGLSQLRKRGWSGLGRRNAAQVFLWEWCSFGAFHTPLEDLEGAYEQWCKFHGILRAKQSLLSVAAQGDIEPVRQGGREFLPYRVDVELPIEGALDLFGA